MQSHRRLTEEDVLKANAHLIQIACARYGRWLEPDDRYQTALYGMLYAIRTHRASRMAFPDYATHCMQRFIKNSERDRSRQEKCQARLSLDMRIRVDGESMSTFAEFLLTADTDMTAIEVDEFLRSLDAEPRALLRLLLNGYSIQEAAKILGLAKRRIAAALHQIKLCALRYFQTQP